MGRTTLLQEALAAPGEYQVCFTCFQGSQALLSLWEYGVRRQEPKGLCSEQRHADLTQEDGLYGIPEPCRGSLSPAQSQPTGPEPHRLAPHTSFAVSNVMDR